MVELSKNSVEELIEDLVVSVIGFTGFGELHVLAQFAASGCTPYLIGRLIDEIHAGNRSTGERIRMMWTVRDLDGTMDRDQLAILARIRWDEDENRDLRATANTVLGMATERGVDVPNSWDAANAAVQQINGHTRRGDWKCPGTSTINELILTTLARHQSGEPVELALELARRSTTGVSRLLQEVVAGKYTSAQRARLLDALATLGGITQRSHYVDLRLIEQREKSNTTAKTRARKLLADSARFAPADPKILSRAMKDRYEQIAYLRRRRLRS